MCCSKDDCVMSGVHCLLPRSAYLSVTWEPLRLYKLGLLDGRLLPGLVLRGRLWNNGFYWREDTMGDSLLIRNYFSLDSVSGDRFERRTTRYLSFSSKEVELALKSLNFSIALFLIRGFIMISFATCSSSLSYAMVASWRLFSISRTFISSFMSAFAYFMIVSASSFLISSLLSISDSCF